ncbi:MAG: nodulation protein NodH, partial [Pseudomonadota bacterium]
LTKRYKMDLPIEAADPGFGKVEHRAAFVQFLAFLKPNLAGQTAIRVDADWASQAKTVEGFAEFVLPDRLIRQEVLASELAQLAEAVGVKDVPPLSPSTPFGNVTLADIYDAEIEKLARAAYARDYLMFGFEDWSAA